MSAELQQYTVSYKVDTLIERLVRILRPESKLWTTTCPDYEGDVFLFPFCGHGWTAHLLL